MASEPPLKGIKVLEFAGLAPGPFAGLMLADAGASVLRIDKPPSNAERAVPSPDLLARHKSSLVVDLKNPRGAALIKRLAKHVDVLIDPFRPGVLEKLGLGPDALLAANPRLIYGRLTGFRRDGRYANMAGHDINYLAASGVLALLGRQGEKPFPPWNILADFAGGGAMLAHGILLALLARTSSGKGQVVEANMVDGSSYLATFPRVALKTPVGNRPRGNNILDSGCPWYDTYETADGEYMSVGALEPQFFRALLKGLGLQDQEEEGWESRRHDTSLWPRLRALFTETFKRKTRAEWEAVFDGTDACCVPVLHYRELESQQPPAREGDQRAAVTLAATPLYAPADYEQGGGYAGTNLAPGDGGERLLAEWAGWERGAQYDLAEGGAAVVLREERDKSKL
ncbi:CoA-transferase family III [Trichoderma citrinoviride]|uniref:CoA-transferase family III n=1 Tax=Trichoderma citrinoviride TaxID=58853 RepID=A0A2T4B0P4_9HYPO|nr:CoA-transferase family III [Trichoderma citrinoviride]PTB62897.1 CoA-transferase family III [Trichoderma citrinoviride]